MVGSWNLLILAMCLSLPMVQSSCPLGFIRTRNGCADEDECKDNMPGRCGGNTVCFNTIGSFYCQCADGFRTRTGKVNFSAETSETCSEINECKDQKIICGPNAICRYNGSHYYCICRDAFISTTGVKGFRQGDNVTCSDIDECQWEMVCGQNATCINTPGSYHCVFKCGFVMESGKSNFSGNQEQCETLNCDVFSDVNILTKKFHTAHDLLVQLKKSCLELAVTESPIKLDGEDLLKRLLSLIDDLLSSNTLNDNRKVSTFLDVVENALRLIGPRLDTPGKNISTTHTELKLQVHKGVDIPQGAVTLSSKQARLNMQLETAAGDPSSYSGFTTLSFLSYANLEDFVDGYFGGMTPLKNQSFVINSKVVTVTVSNRKTSHLDEPIKLTFYHLTPGKPNESIHTCVFWNSSEEGGAWSARGCSVVESNQEYTVCSCTHLGSFAVLMALYDYEDRFELKLITWVGLSFCLICLFICILTFSLISSIQSPRTTIHLHLCISLFFAVLIFLAGISRTENQVVCAVFAGLQHYFYMAAFCWVCLEGIQLFRMVVLVFNINFKTLYMMAGGYGVPAVIVAISALTNAEGYGTKKHCWLNMELIWSFFGPACFIISINIFFFVITVWKLAQKFSSSNPDLENLQKIKTFIITTVAQLCVLGTTWIFGRFQFNKGSIALTYLFTIFGSLQGMMLFIMHCLFSKQVREEYRNILSRFCAPQKKIYSNYEYSTSSKARASKSTQDTGESHI